MLRPYENIVFVTAAIASPFSRASSYAFLALVVFVTCLRIKYRLRVSRIEGSGKVNGRVRRILRIEMFMVRWLNFGIMTGKLILG